MEKLFEIFVDITGWEGVTGRTQSVTLVSFTGNAKGKYFNGRVIGTGVDTQLSQPDGERLLSARYMLEGTDIEGKSCRIFIENNGCPETGLTPRIITDSNALGKYETMELKAELSEREGGVLISILG